MKETRQEEGKLGWEWTGEGTVETSEETNTLRLGAQVLTKSHKIHKIWPWDSSDFIFSPSSIHSSPPHLCPASWTHQAYSYLRTFALPSPYSPRSKHGSDPYCLLVFAQMSPPRRGLPRSLLCLKELQTPLRPCLLCFISLLALTSIWLKL